MQHFRTLRPALAGAALVLAAGLGACAPAFRLKDYQGSDTRLFQAALQEYRKGHHENAIAAFERLTLDLPARDTLLPRAHFFLGKSHYRRREFILAAQSFSRVAESFPTDTLADDALLWTARSYRRLWRKPTLDAQYGQSALTTYQLLASLYPDSPIRAEADRETRRLQNWLATKEYENGMHYLRRKAYDSAIIYFRTVLEKYPQTPRARDAALRLVTAFRAIRYTEDARETCASLRRDFAQDREVREVCAGVPTMTPVAAPVRADSAAPVRADSAAAARADSTAPATTPPR